MKKTMTELISVMTEDDYDVFEDLMASKYRKFIRLYWLIKDFLSNISYLKYEETSKDTLRIKLKVAHITPNYVFGVLQDSIDDDDDVSLSLEDSKITITIIKDE